MKRILLCMACVAVLAGCGRSSMDEGRIDVSVGLSASQTLTEARIQSAFDEVGFEVLAFDGLVCDQVGATSSCYWSVEGSVPRTRIKELRYYQDEVLSVLFVKSVAPAAGSGPALPPR